MSQQGEPDRRAEDQWWHQLYGAPGQQESGPVPRSDSVDDHYAAARAVIKGRQPADRGPADQVPGPRDGEDGGRPEGGEEAYGGRGTDPRTGLGGGAAPGGGGPAGPGTGALPEGFARGGDPRAAGGRGASADRDASVGSVGGDGRPTAAAEGSPLGSSPSGRRSGSGAEGAAAGETGEDRPDQGARSTLRLRTVPRRGGPAGPDAPPAHVGDRPPTYAAEPTAWPLADPENLDALTPDTVLDGGQYGTLTVRAASVRGDSARYRGQPRKDALLAARFGEGDSAVLLIAVASGVRAAEDSHRAARDACRWIASAVGRHSERLAEDIREARRGSLKSGLHRLTDRCLGQLRVRAGELGHEPEEYTAALRCLLLPVDPRCRTRVFFGVGDGGLFRLRDGEWQDLDPHREAGGEAVPAPGDGEAGDAEGVPPAPRFRFRASVGVPGDVLLLCTQGMAEPLRGEPALAGLLAERWSASAPPPGLASFLRDAQVRVKGYADDRTAVAAWEGVTS